MRRVALFGSPLILSGLLLSGCSGLGVFLDDTHDLAARVNRPIGNSENMRLVEGQKVTTQVLTAEPGNVWPGPVPPEPTLEDLQNMPAGSLPPLEGTTPPSIANLPGLVIPAIPHHIQPRPGLYDDGGLGEPLTPPPPAHFSPGYPPPPSPPQSPQGTITPTPRGAAVNTRNPGGFGQADVPTNASGITVPNGDGTSTVILPDGTIKTVPTPK